MECKNLQFPTFIVGNLFPEPVLFKCFQCLHFNLCKDTEWFKVLFYTSLNKKMTIDLGGQFEKIDQRQIFKMENGKERFRDINFHNMGYH